ncbi:bifunctional tryptophan synthase trp1 [Lunasporangiospora selenospora]|uniref:Bifunctional tryptophan synthase trp1 n=1 Tax=Lunasporangiospora selenospora TaxID=979761 RepID=A0A9P6FU15_9FUNG|nr:bifunctional tryptophan synthase trp1 [Lunasporangiospora selenospora]
MTGAPKLRSVQLLDSLEGNVTRGVYSGCLGYIGISAVAARSKTRAEGDEAYTAVPRRVRTAVDMSVVIRTAVLSVLPSNESPETAPIIADASIGAGGALTILSDMKEEWREVLLKSRSVVPRYVHYALFFHTCARIQFEQLHYNRYS